MDFNGAILTELIKYLPSYNLIITNKYIYLCTHNDQCLSLSYCLSQTLPNMDLFAVFFTNKSSLLVAQYYILITEIEIKWFL